MSRWVGHPPTWQPPSVPKTAPRGNRDASKGRGLPQKQRIRPAQLKTGKLGTRKAQIMSFDKLRRAQINSTLNWRHQRQLPEIQNSTTQVGVRPCALKKKGPSASKIALDVLGRRPCGRWLHQRGQAVAESRPAAAARGALRVLPVLLRGLPVGVLHLLVRNFVAGAQIEEPIGVHGHSRHRRAHLPASSRKRERGSG